MKTTDEKSIAAFIHLSTLSQYFFPFGNYIFPLLIWSGTKNKSQFIDNSGKQALNFQLSMLLYTLLYFAIAIPTVIFWFIDFIQLISVQENSITFQEIIRTQNITGFLLLGFVATVLFLFLKLSELFLIIYATFKTSEGASYKYPLTINFIK